ADNSRTVAIFHVVLHYFFELSSDALALECHSTLTININRGRRNLPCPRQANADIRMFAFPGTIDHATHHSYLQGFYPRVLAPPYRQLLTQLALYLLGQLVEESAAGAPTPPASHDHRSGGAQAHGVENRLRNLHLVCANSPALRSQRNTYRIANTLLKQYRQSRCASHYSLASHASLGQTQMQRVIAAPRQILIDCYQILYLTHLAG